MNDLKIFFNVKIIDSGTLSAIGNFGLTPVRYLFNGETVKLNAHTKTSQYVHSFVRADRIEYSEDYSFHSSEKTLFKTAAALALLIPGLILAVAKLASYLFATTRNAHEAIQDYQEYDPISIETHINPLDYYQLKSQVKFNASNIGTISSFLLKYVPTSNPASVTEETDRLQLSLIAPPNLG